MTKIASFIILLMALLILFYTPSLIAGEKNKVYRDNEYWIFRTDPDVSKSGWRKNENFGQEYRSYGYDGHKSNHKENHGNRDGKQKQRRCID
jgi:hypothetical protein